MVLGDGRTLSWSFFLGSRGVVHGYGEDVTDRKRAEETIRAQAAANGHQALHDPLTGLGNRRKLMVDGERKMALASREAPLVLVIFDLDGFKTYNDTFGHPAGDALLAGLARRLQISLPGQASAYRMGGDEFRVLGETDDPAGLLAGASEALQTDGASFTVGSSSGLALIPYEAATLVDTMRLADKRLYASKRTSRTSPGSQTRAALVQLLNEQDPQLGSHASNVAELAGATAYRLGLDEQEVARVRLVAELHDIGKTAIPEMILCKAGPLDEEEWQFVRQHPVIADAFDAMTSHRPYRRALTTELALEELQRCAGTQFDPRIVEVFAHVVEEHALTQAREVALLREHRRRTARRRRVRAS